MLAAMLHDSIAKDAAMNAILAKAKAKEGKSVPSTSHVRIIYDISPEHRGARCMMVDFYTFKATEEDMEAKDFPPEFMADLAVAMVKSRNL